MRKNLLRSAMLLSGLACVLSASAEKRYVQVTSVKQLVSGANYALGGVIESENENFPRFYDMNAEHKVVQTVNQDPTTFAESMIFTLQQVPDLECACIGSNHIDASPIFTLEQGGYTVDVSTGNGAQLSTSTATPAPTTAYIQFVPYTSAATSLANSQTVFSLQFAYDAANNRFTSSRSIGTSGFNRYSNDGNNGEIRCFPNAPAASTTHILYLEIDSENLEAAAGAFINERVIEEATAWTDHFQDRTYAEELKAALIEGASAAISASGYDKTFAGLESETEAYVKSVVKAQVPTVLEQWLDGRIVKLQNQGTTHYMAGHPADGINLGTCEEITAASSWGIRKKGEGWIIKNYDQHFVTGTDNIGVSYDENEAVVVNFTANDDYTVSISPVSDTTKYLRAGANEETGIGEAVWSTENDAYAHWKFYGINYAVQFVARQAEKERLAALIEANNACHLYTVEEHDALVAALNAIDCTEPESNQEKVTKLEEVSAALANLDINIWKILDTKYVAISFDRLKAVVTVNDDLASIYAPNGSATEKSIWQLQYAVDGKFRLYNPASERWLAYIPNIAAVATADDAELFKITAYSATNVAGNPVTLESAASASSKFLHKSASGTGLIKYNNGDPGSALFLSRTSGDFFDRLTKPTSALPNAGTNFRESIGDACASLPADADLESVLKSMITEGDDYDAFVSVINVIASGLDKFEFEGAFITLTPYQEALQHIKVHHSTVTTTVSRNTELVLGLLTTDTAPEGYVNEQTEANSIWFYKDGTLVNYEDGFYAGINKGGTNNNCFGVCNSASSNSGDAVRFFNGKNDGMSQMIVGGDCGLHIHKSGTYVVANRCSSSGTRNEDDHDLNVALVSELPVAVHSDGWGSFYSPITYSIPADAGYTFFGAQIVEESLGLYELAAGTKLAGGTSVLFAGPAGQTVYMPLNYCEEGNADYNGFGGAHIAAPHAESAGMKTFAKTAPAAAESGISTLSVDPNAVVSLSAVTDAAPVHTMTLTVPESDTDINNDGSAFTLRVGELTTGIREIVVNRLDGTRTIYDLQGRRLSEPVKGIINIIDGKKVLVK